MGRWVHAIHGARHRPDDPDILLLHGLFVDSSLWRAQIEPLARLGRVVALDLPGHGASEVPPPFGLAEHADVLPDALALLDASAEGQTPYRKAKFGLLVAFVRRLGLPPWLARPQIAPLMLARRSRRERPRLVEEFVRSATSSRHIAGAIAGARLEWIEDAGHLAPLERPEEVNRLLLPSVASQPE